MSAESSRRVPNMVQRSVMQHLNLTDWKLANRLPIPAGEMMLSRMAHLGWIETKDEGDKLVVRLTEAGFQATRSKIE
jgi:hypothetical protein